jgi:type II secretory pathway component PulF
VQQALGVAEPATTHVPLPCLTQQILHVSAAVRNGWPIFLIGLAALGYAGRAFLRTEHGRWMLDRLALRVPAFCHLFIQLQLAQFARSKAGCRFSTGLRSWSAARPIASTAGPSVR